MQHRKPGMRQVHGNKGSPFVGLAILVHDLVDGKGHKGHALVLAEDGEVA